MSVEVQLEWIKVQDRLPNQFNNYLVIIVDKANPAQFQISASRYTTVGWMAELQSGYTKQVIAWVALQ